MIVELKIRAASRRTATGIICFLFYFDIKLTRETSLVNLNGKLVNV